MRFELVDSFSLPKSIQVPTMGGNSLEGVLQHHTKNIDTVQINGQFVVDWKDYRPGNKDVVRLYIKKPKDIISFFTFLATALTAALGIEVTAFAVGSFLISSLLQIGFSLLSSVLSSAPKQASATGKVEERFGIAGIQNTIAPGTPKFYVLGERRVFPHLIASTVSVANDGKQMKFAALYFTGTGPIESLTLPEINGTPIGDFPDFTFETRLGTASQTVINDFVNVSQVFTDGRTLPKDIGVIATTKGLTVDRAKIIIKFNALFSTSSKGGIAKGNSSILFEFKKPADGSWTTAGTLATTARSQSTLFKEFVIDFTSSDQWEIRATESRETVSQKDQGLPALLFNIEEIQFTTLNYPNNSLLPVRKFSNISFEILVPISKFCLRYIYRFINQTYFCSHCTFNYISWLRVKKTSGLVSKSN